MVGTTLQVKLMGIPVRFLGRLLKDLDVSSFQRFDTDASSPLSERDLKRRWAVFHKAIHDMSGKKWQRVLGQMLGINTTRYKVVRFFGRPLLQAVRVVKGAGPKDRVAAAVVIETFPHNFRLVSATVTEATGEGREDLSSVEVLALNENNDSPRTLIESINATIERSRATWLFLVDESFSEADRASTASALLAQALDSDDVIFGDEFGLNPLTPIFKSPSVGPHTILSYNCVGRPALLRMSAVRDAGGFSLDAGWAFEHDFYLRLSERAGRFHHVAKLLPAGRPALGFDAAHISDDSCRVVEASLDRRGWKSVVSTGQLAGSVNWVASPPSPPPKIDIIIPTRDRVDLMRQCIEAVETKSTYTNYEIIILDNDSKDHATLDFFATSKYRVIACPGPFNYAHIINRGVEHSTAEFIVTLNNDTVLETPDWLERMVGLAALPDVGFVGACLLDQNGKSEHESIVIAPYPQHLRSDSNYPHVDQFVNAVRDVAAVTGAVQMVRRDFWQALGGMDEQLRVTMNDIDICLRSQLEGRYVVYTPDVRLYHHVSSSRGKLDPLADRNRFIQRWDIFGTFRDPYFPASLQLLGETIYYLPR
jgi:GT2 family glycosyltransferase